METTRFAGAAGAQRDHDHPVGLTYAQYDFSDHTVQSHCFSGIRSPRNSADSAEAALHLHAFSALHGSFICPQD